MRSRPSFPYPFSRSTLRAAVSCSVGLAGLMVTAACSSGKDLKGTAGTFSGKGLEQKPLPTNISPLDNHSLAKSNVATDDATKGLTPGALKATLDLDCTASRPAVTRSLKPLTRYQYRASLAALLPPAVLVAPEISPLLSALPSDLAPKKFDSQEGTLPRQVSSETFEAAREIGLFLAGDATARSAFWAMHRVSCSASVTDSGMRDCLSRALDTFGKRAWRRPVAAAEKTQLLGRYDTLAPQSRIAAFAAVVGAVLTREDFFFRIEGGSEAAKKTPLTQHEIAARLSFGITGAVPDATLMTEADAGRLSSTAQIQAQAARLIATSEARAYFRHFARQWLNLNDMHVPTDSSLSDDAKRRAFSEAAADEVASVFERVLVDDKGSLETLFTTNLAKPSNDFIAAAYGVPRSDSLVALTDPNRAGILTRAGVLSSKLAGPSAPHRGYNARVNLLCGVIGSIPTNLDLSPPPGAPDVQSSRQGWERSHSRPACAACHDKMNPLGFVMDNYDGHGRYRTQEAVLNSRKKEQALVPIDARVTIDFGGGESHAVGSLVEFQSKLGGSAMAQVCFMSRFFLFSNGAIEGPNCAVKEMRDTHQAAGAEGGLRAAVMRYFIAPETLEVTKK